MGSKRLLFTKEYVYLKKYQNTQFSLWNLSQISSHEKEMKYWVFFKKCVSNN